MTTTHTVPRMIASNGISLCCDTFGDPSHPALVLIMGLGAQMISWDEEFCAGLAARRLHVVRFDNRDIGKSTRLEAAGVPNTMALMAKAALGIKPKVPYTLLDMARDTAGLMDALGIQRAHVAGASMGGGIAQEMAIHMPDRLLTLTSIMSSTGDPSLPPPTAEALALLFAPTPKDREAYLVHHAKTLRTLRGPHFGEDITTDVERAARNFDRGLSLTGSARQLAAIIASGNRTPALTRVSTPTLVIHGDADPLIRVAGGRATARAITGSKLEILPGMGHTLPRPLWPRIIETMTAHMR
jgi:pimeloyl-ACP methyl ester carboxylesterase